MSNNFIITISVGTREEMTIKQVESIFDQLISEFADKIHSYGVHVEVDKEFDAKAASYKVEKPEDFQGRKTTKAWS